MLLAAGVVASTLYAKEARPERERRARPASPPAAAETPPPPSPRRVPRPERRSLPEGPLAAEQRTRVQLQVFEVQGKAEKITALNSADLHDLDRNGLLARLGEYGSVSLLQRIDLPILLGAGKVKIVVGARVPIVRSITVAKSGTVTPSIDYGDMGCGLELDGVWLQEGDGPPVAHVNLELEWSSVASSSVEVGSGVKLPVMLTVKMDPSVALRSDQPAVLFISQPISAGSAMTEESADAPDTVCLVLRIELTQMAD